MKVWRRRHEGGRHSQVALENIALRQQLAVFTREKKRPRLRDRDRLFWITLQRLWRDWRSALVFVQPDSDLMATPEIQKVLAEIISIERARTPRAWIRRYASWRQSHLGSPAHPWRIAETRV